MTDLTEFLLARIAEDEAQAPKHHHPMCEWSMRGDRGATEAACDCGFARRWGRVLAECEAKRKIVAEYELVCHPEGLLDRALYPSLRSVLEVALRALAAVYADHPDFDKAWAYSDDK